MTFEKLCELFNTDILYFDKELVGNSGVYVDNMRYTGTYNIKLINSDTHQSAVLGKFNLVEYYFTKHSVVKIIFSARIDE